MLKNYGKIIKPAKVVGAGTRHCPYFYSDLFGS
jgi:hypothetical protein